MPERWREDLEGRAHRQQQMSVVERLALPQNSVGKAATYTLNMWPKLRRCFDYAEVELSNNLAENSRRGVALGRKNWLHAESVKSGPKVAAILSSSSRAGGWTYQRRII